MRSICVSLETAKALKAAGWSKPTAFVYEDLGHRQQLRLGAIKMNYGDCYAPTAEEVLRELPFGWKAGQYKCAGHYVKYPASHRHIHSHTEHNCHSGGAELAESAAQMWIWCVENKYIEVKP